MQVDPALVLEQEQFEEAAMAARYHETIAERLIFENTMWAPVVRRIPARPSQQRALTEPSEIQVVDNDEEFEEAEKVPQLTTPQHMERLRLRLFRPKRPLSM